MCIILPKNRRIFGRAPQRGKKYRAEGKISFTPPSRGQAK